ncbi:MAG: hypothetical protein EOP06_01990 [Proteobacteria bacterium]|nr:MAG: hypothetical protein EOP06_01990 [Pseudomonadota bacterium]
MTQDTNDFDLSCARARVVFAQDLLAHQIKFQAKYLSYGLIFSDLNDRIAKTFENYEPINDFARVIVKVYFSEFSEKARIERGSYSLNPAMIKIVLKRMYARYVDGAMKVTSQMIDRSLTKNMLIELESALKSESKRLRSGISSGKEKKTSPSLTKGKIKTSLAPRGDKPLAVKSNPSSRQVTGAEFKLGLSNSGDSALNYIKTTAIRSLANLELRRLDESLVQFLSSDIRKVAVPIISGPWDVIIHDAARQIELYTDEWLLDVKAQQKDSDQFSLIKSFGREGTEIVFEREVSSERLPVGVRGEVA